MRDFLVAHGVPAEQIVTETGSRNTRESALAAAGFLRGLPGRRVLLTSDYHLYRSRRAFAKAGVEVAVRALPDVRKRGGAATGRWSAFQDLCLESAKIAYYRWQGWI
jgi:uncharacterized SAM-binding protein YcdF (DUF218 family)